MAKTVKKVDPKTVVKSDVMAFITKSLVDAGYVVVDGSEYGMTAGTVVVKTDVTDVQIKPIVPKAGITEYVVAE